MASFIGQLLLAAPFVVFAYWYEQEETLFQATPPTATIYPTTMLVRATSPSAHSPALN
jgi:hypothetical protein